MEMKKGMPTSLALELGGECCRGNLGEALGDVGLCSRLHAESLLKVSCYKNDKISKNPGNIFRDMSELDRIQTSSIENHLTNPIWQH